MAIEYANKALQMDPKNIKAYYRLACAYEEKG